MNKGKHQCRSWIALAPFLVGACLAGFSSPRLKAQTLPALKNFSTNTLDRLACQAKLNKVYEAILEFQKAHRKLPDWLSDLHPEFIDSPRAFVCPHVERLGDLEAWRAGVRGEVFSDPILPNSYSYEFCANTYQLWAGINSTEQEYKMRQMKVEGVGENVPIIRCLAHDPKLNLAYQGRFYLSGREWENNFTNQQVLMTDLLPNALFRDLAPQSGTHPELRPRPPETPSTQLDLTPHYHVPLHQAWLFRNPKGKDLASLATEAGRMTRTSVPFDARGLIQLRSPIMPSPYPERMEGIVVGGETTILHFLLGTVNKPFWQVGKVELGEVIGAFGVRYEGGRELSIPIVYGLDVLDWLTDPSELREGVEAEVAWQGSNVDGPVRLYILTWFNPVPKLRIEAVSFESTKSESAPFLVAITLGVERNPLADRRLSHDGKDE